MSSELILDCCAFIRKKIVFLTCNTEENFEREIGQKLRLRKILKVRLSFTGISLPRVILSELPVEVARP